MTDPHRYDDDCYPPHTYDLTAWTQPWSFDTFGKAGR